MQCFNLYIHFPFCIRKCPYCDFYSEHFREENCRQWFTGLLKEIRLYGERYPRCSLGTIYIGGGTPNLIGIPRLQELLANIRNAFRTDRLAEFTIELNPGIVDDSLCRGFKSLGIDRVSLGAQSFHDSELQTLGRIHRRREIENTLRILKQTGLENINIDLIYGIPGQTLQSWQTSVKKAIGQAVPHLSLYNLTWEAGTPFQKMRSRCQLEAMAEDLEWALYNWAHKHLAAQGYIHYEISNWAREGYASKHNCQYWSGTPYLGLGPSAHSYDGQTRWWNMRNLKTYLKILAGDTLPVEDRETLSKAERDRERLLLALRTYTGIGIAELERITGMDIDTLINKLIDKGIKPPYWKVRGSNFYLTHRGWFIADHIIGEIEKMRTEE